MTVGLGAWPQVGVVAAALIRLLRGRREVQTVALHSIASMSVRRRDLFEPHLKNFFVRTTDATQIKLLKLEVLTNLAAEANISLILREFQTYIGTQDKDLIAATIQAIGRDVETRVTKASCSYISFLANCWPSYNPRNKTSIQDRLQWLLLLQNLVPHRFPNQAIDCFHGFAFDSCEHRCASKIKEVTDVCLSGLIALLSNADGEFDYTSPRFNFS